MKHYRMLSCIFLLLGLTYSVCAAAVEGDFTDPYQVILFRDRNYTNQMLDATLPGGMRMLKIPVVNGMPLSAMVGSKVGMLIFPDYDFQSCLYSGLFVRFYRVVRTEPALYDAVYGYNHPSPPVTFSRCSIIIYRRDINDILGIYYSWHTAPYDTKSCGQFLPLPENPDQKEITYIKFQKSVGYSHIAFESAGEGIPPMKYLEVTIVSTDQKIIKLPDPKKLTYYYDLKEYKIDEILSMHLKYVGPYTAQAYAPKMPITTLTTPDSAHLEAPPAPATAVKTQAATQVTRVAAPPAPSAAAPPSPAATKTVRVPPSATASPPTSVARTAAPAAVTPAAPVIPDISGQWKSSVNRVYNITQTKNKFQWTVVNDTEVGEGLVQDKDIYASWKGKMGPGSISGKITAVDTKGKATQILWNNGVWFNR